MEEEMEGEMEGEMEEEMEEKKTGAKGRDNSRPNSIGIAQPSRSSGIPRIARTNRSGPYIGIWPIDILIGLSLTAVTIPFHCFKNPNNVAESR